MADVSDAGLALVALIATAIYPGGTTQPSVADCPVLVYPGWPDPDTLQADLKAGKAHVSVFPKPGDRVTSVVMGDGEWQPGAAPNTGEVEVRRQSTQFQVTVWASRPDQRDTIGKVVDAALAWSARVTLVDGSTATVSYQNAVQDDSGQRNGIYRRDLFYWVNYPIVHSAPAYPITATQVDLQPEATPDVPIGSVLTFLMP